MIIHKYKNIEFAEVNLSDLYNDRIDAEYYKPEFIRNSRIIETKPTIEVKDLMYPPQYGLSLAMNEDSEGYKILKMDDIVGVLADDVNAKYADISSKLFKSYELKKFDVLFNRVNSDDFVGRTGIYLLEGKHTFASYLVRVTSKYSYQNCYLTIFLNCKHGYNCLQRVKRRAVNQANINAQELKALKIPIPSVSFQKKIETLVLECYEQKQQSEILYREAEQILLQALGLESWQPQKRKYYIKGVEFETINSISEANLSEMFSSERLDSEFWQPFYEDAMSVLTKANYVDLGHYKTARLQKGNQARTDSFGKFPYASIKDCNNLEINTTEKGEGEKAVFAEPESLVLAITGATIGKVAMNITDETIAISGDLVNIESVGDLSNAYLLTVLNSPMIQALCKRFTTGATNGHLSVSNVAKFPIPIIERQKQKDIEKRIKTMFLNRQRSKFLLDIAKRAVEIYIEKDEVEAEKYLAEKLLIPLSIDLY
jgi:type I restriction enzyme, S subunit